MVLTLHGNIHSTCTSRVRTVLEELNVPYEFVGIDFAKGEHKAPAFVAVQPFGQVPYLDDDGFKVFESRAIARYIALKHGGVGTLIPAQADAQKTALFEQAASIEMSNFDPSAAGLAFENIFKVYVLSRSIITRRFDADRDGGVRRMHGGKTDPATVERLKTTLEAKLAAYDVILGKTKFLAGDVSARRTNCTRRVLICDNRRSPSRTCSTFLTALSSRSRASTSSSLASSRT